MDFTRMNAILALSFVSLLMVSHATSYADEKFGDWSKPVNLDTLSPQINTSAREGCQVLSADGLSLYFASDQPDSSRDASRQDLDLWVAERQDKKMPFSAPYHLGNVINSQQDEVCPTLSKNGRALYFASNRIGGCGDRDLYLSVRNNKYDNLNWQTPLHLGCKINSTSRDHGASIFRLKKAKTFLYFSSNRSTNSENYRGHNIYQVKLDKNGIPILSTLKIVKGVSSINNDSRPFLRKDGLEIFFDRDVKNSNREEIWAASRDKNSHSFSNAVPITALSSTGRDIRPSLNKTATTLYFTSTRSEGSLGRADIWVSTRIELEDEDESREREEEHDEGDD